MKIFEKKSAVKVDSEDIKDARLSSADFVNENVKKRAYVNVLGARLAMKMLFSQKIEANNLYSLYTIHSILEELNIADIYYNGIKMDVRLVFDKNQIFVPKSHFEYSLTPDLYLVLQLKEDQSGADFLGFFEPKDLDKQNENTDYYFYESENLQKPESLKSFLEHFIVENDFSEEGNEEAEALFLSFVDKEIASNDKLFLLKKLASSLPLREKIVEFENFEILSKRVAQTGELIQDGLLDIVGSQKLYDEDADSTSNAKAEIIGEVLTDMLIDEEHKDNYSSLNGGELAAGALAVAAGLGLGSEIVKASSQAAAAGITAQGELIAGGADVLSSGIDLGGKLVENAFESSINKQTNDQSIDESDLLNEIDNFLQEDESSEFSLADLNEIDTIDESDSENFEIESFEDEESKEENLFEIETEPEETITEFEDIEEISDEIEEINGLDELDGLDGLEEFENFEQATQTPEETITSFEDIEEITDEKIEIGEIEELEDLQGLEETENFEEESDINNEPEVEVEESEEVIPEIQSEQAQEDVFDLENFDFDMLGDNDETKESDSDAVSLDSIDSEEEKPQEVATVSEDTELDAIQRLQQLEEQEESKNSNEPESEDFISQVDDFLNEINLSDEQKSLLENELASGIDLEENIPAPAAKQGEFSQDDLFMDTDALLAQAEQGGGSNKDPLKLLFKEGENEVKPEGLNFDIKRIPTADLLKNKKVIVAASVAGAMIVTLAIGGVVMHNKNKTADLPKDTTEITAQGEAPTQSAPEDMTMDLNQPIAQEAMPSQPQEIPADNPKADANRDMGKAVSDAFLSEPVNTSITKVAWEVPEDLAYNDSFRKYLQIAGKNLKLNLQNDLLLATEMAYSNKVVVDLEIAGNGNLNAANVAVSSGSKQIDKIVLQSIKDTLKYLKLPSSEVGGKSVVATLIINF